MYIFGVNMKKYSTKHFIKYSFQFLNKRMGEKTGENLKNYEHFTVSNITYNFQFLFISNIEYCAILFNLGKLSCIITVIGIIHEYIKF